MKNKRIFALLMTLVMLCTSFGAVYAENTENTEASAEEVVITPLDTDEFYALYAMGFIGDELLETDKDAYITRAQFTGYLFKLAGYPLNSYNTDAIPFIDVNTTTPYYNEICTMYEMGIVNGTDPNMFSPDAHVTYSQACKLIIDVLGYRTYAEVQYGEYPQGYVSMAAELDINDGVKNVKWNSELTADDAVTMLYNAGMTELMAFSGVGESGSPTYSTDGTTLFEKNDIYYAEGTMESDGILSIKGEPSYGTTVISGISYESADTDLSEFVGCKVKYFYRDNGLSKKVLCATIDKRYSNMLEFNALDLAVTSSEYTLKNIVYYEDDGTTDSAKINPQADVIYNNTRCGIPTLDDIKPMTGTMRLIDNNDDEIYDVVIVYEYDNLFVTHIVEEKEQIFAKYNKTIDFADYDIVKIIKDGKEVTINDIDNQSIVSYIENKEKTKIYLYPVNESYKSVVKSSKIMRGRDFYLLDSGTYCISNAYKAVIDNPKEYAVSPEIGKEYKFWLDIFGEIAEVQMVSEGLQYALLMSVRAGEPYEDYTAYTRLLMPDGSKVTGAIDKKISVNGERKTGEQFLKDTRLYEDGIYAEGKECMVQVVQVEFDNEGNLKTLNFASDTSAQVDPVTQEPLFPYGFDISTFSCDYIGDDKRVINRDSYILLDNKYLVTDNTVVFGKWSGMDTTEPYVVGTKNTLGDGTYDTYAYDVNENMEVAAVYRASGLGTKGMYQTNTLVVDEIDYVLSDDDEEVKRISGYMGKSYTSFVESEPGAIPASVGHGDLVKVSVYDGKLTNVHVMLSYEDIKNKNTQVVKDTDGETNGYSAEDTWVFAPVYRMDTNSTTIMVPTDWEDSVGGPILTSPRGDSSVTMIVFDVKNDEIYVGDSYEMYHKYTVLADTTVPEDSDEVMVYMRMRYITAKEIILMVY